MTTPTETVFVDTSIQIARVLHSQETKDRIENRLRLHSNVVTGLVVRQEFKRRVLKEAKYLLEQLNRLGTLMKLRRHLQENLPQPQERKRSICLAILQTVDEQDTEEDHTERLRLFLRSLLRDGLKEFDSAVNQVLGDSGCACALLPVHRKKGDKEQYEFGTDKCSQIGGECGVVAFLTKRAAEAQRILHRLENLASTEKTDELSKAEQFLRRVLPTPSGACKENPCLTVGDLLIALESVGVRTFYTMNRRESQHLCPALEQDLVVRPKNAVHEDEIIPSPRAIPLVGDSAQNLAPPLES